MKKLLTIIFFLACFSLISAYTYKTIRSYALPVATLENKPIQKIKIKAPILKIKLDVKVDLIENLGFEKIIYAKLSDNQITIKSSEDINNQPLKISFSKDKVLFFDKNKNRIR